MIGPIFAFNSTVALPAEVTKVMVVLYVPALWEYIAGVIFIVHDAPGARLRMSE
jgi:hypothetical protein